MRTPYDVGAVDIDVEGVKAEEGKAVSRVYPSEVHDLFAGEQLVMVGRYKKPGDAKVTITGKVGDDEKKMDFPAKFVESSSDQTYGFVEKLWAMRRVGEIIDELDLSGKNDELIAELTALSTKHGILTPYTSFLADENSTINELSDARGNAARTRQLVDRLATAGGVSGVAQRAEKKSLREANQVTQSADSAPVQRFAGPSSSAAPATSGLESVGRGRAGVATAPSRTPARAGRPGIGGGGMGMSQAGSPGSYGSGVTFRDIDSDQQVRVDSVQQIGNETLYKRGNIWVAKSAQEVDLEKDAAKIQTVKRFSDDYFDLVVKNSSQENAVLAHQKENEELLIKLRGQVYRIN